ncbi:guanine nucleotide-binding protein G(s) subunit alpha-like protein [Leptotrombidium deliense]|uniref:Guanine nucleotide-binding protein G(s) subunit alpha n=1 Tax=Leptotrombidium deliense TaxID=299467 RepID=A0A443SAJ7_9ACAR|nr:guanine nucleotide-binding protein G(s) subunit alpha-like protein [Leptotrombidium deliense]
MPFKCWRRTKDSDRKASKEIDKSITRWMKNYKKSIKLLLLGAGESGKTTIIKQMKILHIKGFSDEERKEKVIEIRINLLEAIKELTANMIYLDPPITVADSSNQKFVDFINSVSTPEECSFSEQFYDSLQKVWTDEGVQQCFQRCNEYAIMDSAKYFLDQIDTIRRNDYIPSDADILRCRRRTSDIQKIEFEVKVPLKYGGGAQSFWLFIILSIINFSRMFDVGGQRGERRKWIQVFDGITAVLFLVACSGFDTRIREDNQTNRLQEALKLFEEVWSSRFLRDSGFILFLNKQDILREKVENGADLSNYFTDYTTYKSDENEKDALYEYKKARAFIRDKFIAVTKKKPDHRKFSTGDYIYFDNYEEIKKRECFWHYTIATDTDNIKKVFNDVHTMIILWNLNKISPT